MTSDAPPRPRLPIARHLTWDELHAAILGVVGAPVAWGFVSGDPLNQLLTAWVTGMLTLVVLFDLPRSRTGRLLGRETWYFAIVFLASAGIAGVWL